MTPAHDAMPSLVRSRDGTEIAYWTTGTGPPLVVVHGTPADHTRWRPLLPCLEPHFTVHAIDRRDRGASDTSKPHAETVAAALPNARIVVLDGQGHVADALDPAAFAAQIVPFLRSAT